MPRVMRDYHCSVCNTVEERITFTSNSPVVLTCHTCASPLSALVSASRFKLDPISGDFPSATRQFDLVHRQATHVENNRSYYDPT
jgi:hypothetical protein